MLYALRAERNRLRLLRSLPKRAVCAEIGMWKGDFSRRILSVTQPRELHLIDPWMFAGEYPDRWYGGKIAKGQSDMDRIYEHVVASLGSAATVHRGKSADVIDRVPSLDWIYLDGDHGFEGATTDLELSKAKVRSGAVICGDDYYWGADKPVKRAVDAFVAKYGLEMRLFGSQFRIQV
jgi:hypothetical protein